MGWRVTGTAVLERVAREGLWWEGIWTENREEGGREPQGYLEEEGSRQKENECKHPLSGRVPGLGGNEQCSRVAGGERARGRVMGEVRKSSVREMNWFPQDHTAGLGLEPWSFRVTLLHHTKHGPQKCWMEKRRREGGRKVGRGDGWMDIGIDEWMDVRMDDKWMNK